VWSNQKVFDSEGEGEENMNSEEERRRSRERVPLDNGRELPTRRLIGRSNWNGGDCINYVVDEGPREGGPANARSLSQVQGTTWGKKNRYKSRNIKGEKDGLFPSDYVSVGVIKTCMRFYNSSQLLWEALEKEGSAFYMLKEEEWVLYSLVLKNTRGLDAF